MSIKAADVKELRAKTGAGMMECKKALVESGGDAAKAEKILKELGLAAAQKRSGRATKEGRIFSLVKPNKAILLEISCETDFVSKNKGFIAMGEKLVQTVDEKGYTEINDELTGIVNETLAKIKENLSLKRFSVIEAEADELLTDYIHGEGRAGVLVKLKTGKAELNDNEKIKQLGNDLCLHIAFHNPPYMTQDEIDANYLKEQEEIFTKQAENLDKPEKVIAGIVKGKIKKHMAEICLVDQKFVKDESKTIAQVLAETGKELGTTLAVTGYACYKLGVE